MSDDLTTIKQGDDCFVSGRSLTLTKAVRVTKTHITTTNGTKFNIKNGRKVSTDRWFHEYLRAATDETRATFAKERAEEERVNLALRLRDTVNWRALSKDALDRIAAIIKESIGGTA